MRALYSFSLLAGGLLFSTHQACATEYEIKDLGDLGGSYILPKAINSQGEIVGQATTAANSYDMFHYNGTMTNLSQQLGLGRGLATSTNNNGDIIGKAVFPSASAHDFFISNDQGVTNLSELIPEITNATNGQLGGINDDGVIVGAVGISDKSAFTLTPQIDGYELNYIGIVGKQNWGIAINNNGQAVGFTRDDSGPSGDQAFFFDGINSYEIGSLGGYSQATDINDSSAIVGHSFTGNQTLAFVYQQGSMTALGTIGGSSNQALGINNDGRIVGWAYNASYKQRAVEFFDQSATDLNTLLPEGSPWVLNKAYGINDEGVIIGEGTYNGVKRAFVLSPINLPPVSNAGGPYQNFATVGIIFDATASTDPEGEPLTYSWDFGDGSISSEAVVEHAYTSAGTYTVILTVTDSKGQTHSDTTQAEIADHPPIASAGLDKTVPARTRVTLDGQGSLDPDGEIVSYQWQQLSGKKRLRGTYEGSMLRFRSPSQAGDLVFELKVTDSLDQTSTDQVTITVIR